MISPMDPQLLSTSQAPSIASEDDSVVNYVPEQLEDPVSEDRPALPQKKFFPLTHILEITLSEPRDVLTSERTFLSFVRFAISLYFIAIGMILGFRVRSAGKPLPGGDRGFNEGLFNHFVSYLLIFLSFAILLVCAFSYFNTVRRLSQKRIHTYAASNTVMVACVSAIVITLIAVNISMIVERYIQER